MQLRAGLRLQSTTCDTQVIVVRAPGDDLDLRCGGGPMVPMGEEAARRELAPAFAEGTAMGKRYGSDELGLEILCTRPGQGSLSLGPDPIPLKEAKLLPSSD